MANPKKSKAFIITFILILLLLLVGYWLYSKKDTILSTNGLNLGRIFEPLIGSLNIKDVGVIGDPKDNMFDKIANTTGVLFDSIFNRNDNNQDNNYEYGYNPNNNISNLFICDDNVDNDVDGKTDKLDPECHSDGDIYNTYSYVPTWTSESVRPSPACNNKNDDDKDGKIDIEDPECHTDGNANNVSSYSLNHFSESVRIVISQCGDGIDNDKKEGIDSEDPSCHTDFNKDNTLSYDKNIKNEGRIKISAQCGDGLNNDNKEGADYKDKDCHTDLNINNWESYYPDIYTEEGVLPTPGEECANRAINYPICDDPGSNFCSQNKITKELEKDKAANDKEQVRSLQLILSKLVSLSLGTTYLKASDVDGIFGEGTRLAVETFQKDNGLNFAIKQGSVDKETMDLLNAKCEQFLNGGGEKCTNGAVNPTLCTIDANGKCLNKAVNPPICTINSDGKCLNGAINPPTCNVQPIIEINKCQWLDNFTLEFTESEQARLAELLRKFYIIAPSLKTEDDLNLVYNEIDNYNGFIKQIEELTNQCALEKSSGYSGPTTTFGNPWYKPEERGSYVNPYANYFSKARYEEVFAEENIKNGEFVYLTGTNSSGIKTVKKWTSDIQICGGSLNLNLCFHAIMYGSATENIDTGKIGKIHIPDLSPSALSGLNYDLSRLSANLSFWKEVPADNESVLVFLFHEFEILLNIW